MVVLLNDSDGL